VEDPKKGPAVTHVVREVVTRPASKIEVGLMPLRIPPIARH